MSTLRYQPVKHAHPNQVRYKCVHEDRPAARATYDDENLVMLRTAFGQIGWSLAVHGSLQRDIDLVAVPWTEDAEPALAAFNVMMHYGYVLFGGIQSKSHGRLAALFSGPADRVIDLSVMPIRSK